MTRSIFKRLLLVLTLVFVSSLLLGFSNSVMVFADGDGFIGTGTVESGTGGGGGGGHTGCDSSTDNSVECRGVSWIYYEATGNAGENGTSIYFSAPYDTGDNLITIPATCSLSGRGFWHFGRNAIAISSKHYSGYFSDYKRLMNHPEGSNKLYYENVYLSTPGKNGHMKTYNWGYNGDGNSAFSARFYRSFGNLDHRLYKKMGSGIDNTKPQLDKYKLIYRATKSAAIGNSGKAMVDAKNVTFTKATASNIDSLTPEVWKDFNKAWYYANKEYYTGTNFPDNLKFFCYWEFEDTEVTLSGQAKDDDGNNLTWPSGTTKSVKVDKENEASLTAPSIGGYTFMYWKNEDGTKITSNCPSTDKTVECIGSDDGKTIKIESMSTNRTLTAVYAKRTLELCAKDTDGNDLNWPFSTNKVTVPYGNTATASPLSLTGYDFLYWKNESNKTVTTDCPRDNKSYACKDGNDLKIETLIENRKFCAIYQIQDRTLTVEALDEDANYLNDSSLADKLRIADVTATVNYNQPAYVDRNTNANYDFVGWKVAADRAATKTANKFTNTDTSKEAWLSNSGTRYNVAHLKLNPTIYAIYSRKQVTLTLKAVDKNGNPMDGNGGRPKIDDVVRTVYYGEDSSVTATTPPSTSYWSYNNCIKESTSATTCLVTGSTYTVNEMKESKTVFAVYAKDEYAGKISVYEGNSTSGTNFASTGWTEESDTISLTIDCLNAGCSATFDLRLKTISGNGKTPFAVKRKKNNGSYTTVATNPASPYAPSAGTNGTFIGKTSGNYVESLGAGERVCYQLSFMPRGSHGGEITTLEACVAARESLFEGKSSVTGAVDGATDWINVSDTTIAFINDCSPTSGCSVSFNHRLRRTQGTGSTDYRVSRSSNMTETSKGVANDSNVATGVFNSSEAEVSSSGPFTLYPGMVVCETLIFKPSNSVIGTVSDVSSKICASALGKAQPDDPTETPDPTDPDCPTCPDTDPNGNDSSSALVDIEVKNNTVSKYNTYRRVVYAKPGDSLTFRATYNPILQYTYYLKPQQVRIGSGQIYPQDEDGNALVNTTATLPTIFNTIQGSKTNPEPGWNNDIYVRSLSFYSNSFSSAYDYPNGDASKRAETNDHEVLKGEGGRSISENAYVNYSSNDTVKTTPRQIVFSKTSSNNNLGTVTIGQKYKTAYARIPYNYTTNIRITTPTDDPVYPGEDMGIDYEVDVVPKDNPVTNNPGDPPYATKTISSDIRVVVYIGSDSKPGTDSWAGDRNSDLCGYYGTVKDKSGDAWDCSHYVATTRTLNSSGNLDGVTESSLPRATFSIPDLDAGTKICAATAIFPSHSGDSRNYNNTNGNGTWRISDSKCFTIGKKPNLQVLGGGIYSAKNIITSVAVKRNVFGIYPVSLTSRANTTIFGSWGEQQIVSVGSVTGLASGAATGYFGTTSANPPTSGRTPVSGLGGSKEGSGVDFCIRSPLTMANSLSATPCRNRSVTGGLTASSAETIPTDKEKLIARFTEGASSESVNYEKKEGNYTINAMTTSKGQTHVIHATGTITINGDLIYEDGYAALADVPKLIIYAEENITISCGVSRIDAILIAGKNSSANGVVNTCPTDLSSQAEIDRQINSRQLKVNGAIIANKLVANRTYGAAKGVNSVVPAEIIDYDSTLYLWGMEESKGSSTGRLSPTYQHEVAPRY